MFNVLFLDFAFDLLHQIRIQNIDAKTIVIKALLHIDDEWILNKEF